MKSFTSMFTGISLLAALVVGSGCEIASPFEGPAIQDGKFVSEQEGPFLVSATWIALKDEDGAQQKFDELMAPLQEQLKTQPGLLAYSLALKIGSNDDYRTMTVWENEEAMLGWVASDNHVAAMNAAGDIAEDGGVVTWTEEDKANLPPTLDEAKRRLDADARLLY